MGLKHGMRHTRFYNIWCGVKRRCRNKNDAGYQNYGGRGIEMCEEWNEFEGFKNDMYESYLKHVEEHGESNTSIERIDNNGNYCIGNCKWATRKEQNRNTRQVKLYEYKGEMLDLAEIARREGMNYRTLRSRLFDHGWALEEALERSHVKWSKRKVQLYEYKGQKLTLKKIAEAEGINYVTLHGRIKKIGLSLEDAINKTPRTKTR